MRGMTRIACTRRTTQGGGKAGLLDPRSARVVLARALSAIFVLTSCGDSGPSAKSLAPRTKAEEVPSTGVNPGPLREEPKEVGLYAALPEAATASFRELLAAARGPKTLEAQLALIRSFMDNPLPKPVSGCMVKDLLKGVTEPGLKASVNGPTRSATKFAMVSINQRNDAPVSDADRASMIVIYRRAKECRWDPIWTTGPVLDSAIISTTRNTDVFGFIPREGSLDDAVVFRFKDGRVQLDPRPHVLENGAYVLTND